MEAIVGADEGERRCRSEKLEIGSGQKKLIRIFRVQLAAGIERDNLDAPVCSLRVFLSENGVETFRELLLCAVAAVAGGAKRAGEQNDRERANDG